MSRTGTRITPFEMRVRRAGSLALSQSRLGQALNVAQSRISDWEKGARSVPVWMDAELTKLEAFVEDLTDAMIDALELDPGAPLILHTTDETFWEAHPECKGSPFELQHVAAAAAARTVEVRPRLIEVAD